MQTWPFGASEDTRILPCPEYTELIDLTIALAAKIYFKPLVIEIESYGSAGDAGGDARMESVDGFYAANDKDRMRCCFIIALVSSVTLGGRFKIGSTASTCFPQRFLQISDYFMNV
jgi:hypothetical protein